MPGGCGWDRLKRFARGDEGNLHSGKNGAQPAGTFIHAGFFRDFMAEQNELESTSLDWVLYLPRTI